jgi:arylsulfatase A-like enzyme
MKLNLTRRLCLLLWLGIVIGWPVERAVAKPPNVLLIYIVSTMDERIGQVLDFLDQQGLTDNTIVVLQSDHGHSTEERTFGGGGSAGPYRGAKFSLFEGGIRVPAMISWPQHIPQGAIRGQLATAVDWLPTLCALSDVPLPPNPIGGKDLRAVLQSGEVPTPHEVFHWESGFVAGNGN